MYYKQYLKSIIYSLFLVLSTNTYAQHIPFYKGGAIKIETNSLISNPFTGGFNNGQLSMFDVNLDGIKDLIQFDKTQGRVMVYLKASNGFYTYSDYFSQKFPRCFSFLKFADLNSDGLDDIFTLTVSFNLSIYLNTSIAGDSVFSYRPVGDYSPDFKAHLLYYRTAQPIDPSEPWLGMSSFGMGNFDIPYIGDADNDGDIDILTYNPSFAVYELFKDVRVEKGLSKDTFEFQIMDRCFGYFSETNTSEMDLGNCYISAKLKPRHESGSNSELIDLDGDGDKELLITNGVYNHITAFTNGKMDFNHEFDTMISYDTLFPSYSKRANQLFFPTMSIQDFDNDNIQDLTITPTQYSENESQSNIVFYKGTKSGNNHQFHYQENSPFANLYLDLGSYSSPALIDLDRDGDMDLLVAAYSHGSKVGTQAAWRIFHFDNVGSPKRHILN